ncbi:hypothetical protein H072_11032 [Dactylellina haptotyla CBS 200.50]|uniref:DUF7136 domain-containing protein n=1 Tax=Dactylellina haptotyla (strain CBS 200.50) TaxID=1284197 RepID=S7ZYK8_DACHA|nr:hypothetical protein H072_11032 [Dactylellina haptotyla CBS 200.50]
MHPISRAIWSLVGSLACVGTIVNAAGVAEIDIVFPRTNGTYAPTEKFPIVFAVQNIELAKVLVPAFFSFVRNGTNMTLSFGHSTQEPTWGNYSSEPYFVWRYVNIDTEGPYEVFSTVSWRSCDESSDQVAILSNTTNFLVPFTIKRGAQDADLVAATDDDKICSAKGIAINFTNRTYDVPPNPIVDRQPSGTCAVLASASPTVTANPCRVKIDSAVVASMDAWYHAALCKGLNPPADCPKENNAGKLATVAVASFAAVLGAIGFILA